jgi:uncharacterized membrane protein
LRSEILGFLIMCLCWITSSMIPYCFASSIVVEVRRKESQTKADEEIKKSQHEEE